LNYCSKKLLPGSAQQLGATADAQGVNFALFSAHADRVELCVFDETGQHETARYDLPEKTADIWHGYAPMLSAGAVYGYRVHGAYEPTAGHRFNPNKLLLDPYARQLCSDFQWHESHFAYCRDDKHKDLSFDTRDNASFMPKGVVTSATDKVVHRPSIPWSETTLYELHVRGFTLRHPEIPELQSGTFAGLALPQITDYIRSLGVSSIELLPVHSFISEHFLHKRGLQNYWGYNSLSFFTPHSQYMSGSDPLEFRRMVGSLHEAGIEVILDVVYNHSCEGDHLGPTVSFRGIDNASYYRLQQEKPRFYVNDTGCGNTLNTTHPQVLRLVMDSLRYWYQDMGVDGFRFDLASILGREQHGFDAKGSFFKAVSQDPLLSNAKLIAEPWDIGPGGYQLGHYPVGWSEWNDEYRDSARRYWLGEAGQLATFARRLHGSSDIFEHSGRQPAASINYICSHDGFTLRDLVSYEQRHNEANGENNKDGHRHNLSCNFGVEGPTDTPAVATARLRQQRNLIATVLLSQGVPMLLAGDELNRTQKGNNNAYCQDNELNWLEWDAEDQIAERLHRFTRRVLSIRQQCALLRYPRFIHADSDEAVSIRWLNADGDHMRDEQWQEHHNHVLGYLLQYAPGRAEEKSNAIATLVLFNSGAQPQSFTLPASPGQAHWRCVLDTVSEDGCPAEETFIVGQHYPLLERSVVVLVVENANQRNAANKEPNE